MLSVISISSEKYEPADSWVFSSDPTALNWLLIQGGINCILAHAAPYLEQSIWLGVFMESEDEHHTFDNHTPGREGLHAGLANLCDIDDTTTENDNPYHWPLRLLSPMLKLEATGKNIGILGFFIARLSPEFINLLLQKDTKALVILCYYLGKMCLLKHWWIHSRSWSECRAICMYLENSQDPRVLKLLEFPAELCGYHLRHVKEEAIFEANFDLMGIF
jgi:hypothetical protein